MTSLILMAAAALLVTSLVMFLFRCVHAWEFVDKTELISKLEEAKKNGINVNYILDWRIQEMSKKKVVIVIRCPKCGAAKVFRESN